MKKILLFFICLSSINLYSQPWLHDYGTNWLYRSSGFLVNDYDKGYLLTANVANSINNQHCILYKIDDNGFVEYEKLIGADYFEQGRYDIPCPTDDGGLALVGGTWSGDMNVNPSILRLDACKNKIWCTTLNNNPIEPDFFWDAVETADGSIVAVSIQNDPDFVNYPLHLHKFSPSGDQVWKKKILSTDQHPLIESPDPWDLDLLYDGSMILSGYCYWPDPGSTEITYIRMFVAKFDSEGNEIWLYVHGIKDFQYSLGGFSVVNGENIYTAGTFYPNYNVMMPNLFKVKMDGSLVGSYPLNIPPVNDQSSEGGFLISEIRDGNHFLCSTNMYQDQQDFGYNAFIKIDTLGNLLDFFMPNDTLDLRIPGCPVITKSNNVIINSNNTGETLSQYGAFALRLLTDSLRFDSIPYSNFVYDSLCNHSIMSSTITLDSCLILVNNEYNILPPANTQLIMTPSPVPAIENLLIKFQNTIQFNDIQVVVYNSTGQQFSKRSINRGVDELKLEILNWPAGIYLVVAYSNAVKIGNSKFVIIK
jgi:hypothetical protein